MLPAQTVAAPLASNIAWDRKEASVFFSSFPSAFTQWKWVVSLRVLEKREGHVSLHLPPRSEYRVPQKNTRCSWETKTAESEVRKVPAGSRMA